MDSIYESAYLTLAATSAADGEGGFMVPRLIADWVRLPCDPTDEEKRYMWFTNATWTAQSDIDEGPLNQRGWVSQEKVLSQRIIYFASSQVYWECREQFVGQEHTGKLQFVGLTHEWPRLEASIKAIERQEERPTQRSVVSYDDIDLNSPLENFHEIWRRLIEFYCTRGLTKSKDRLPALLSMAGLI